MYRITWKDKGGQKTSNWLYEVEYLELLNYLKFYGYEIVEIEQDSLRGIPK